MTYSAVILVVLGSGLIAGFLAWQIRRTVRLDALRRHHEVGSAVFLQLGVIYAVLLAFVFSEVWSEYNTAANAINEECAALHGAAILASVLAPEQRRTIEGELQAYIAAVVEQEWPDMAGHRMSDAASLAFRTVWSQVAQMPAAGTGIPNIGDQILSQLGDAHRWRETRLFQMQLGVPPVMWVLLIGIGLVLVGFLLCFGIEYVGSQVLFTSVFAAAIAFVLVLVRLLDFPFEGSLRLPPTDFQATLQKVVALGDR